MVAGHRRSGPGRLAQRTRRRGTQSRGPWLAGEGYSAAGYPATPEFVVEYTLKEMLMPIKASQRQNANMHVPCQKHADIRENLCVDASAMPEACRHPHIYICEYDNVT